MLRSLTAILAGLFFIAFATSVAHALVGVALPGAFDGDRVRSTPMLLLIQGYVGLIAVTGCYLAARIAASRPLLHALILGAISLALNAAGTAANWEAAPSWYHLLALALVLPYAWLGGMLARRRLSRAEAPGAVAAAR